MRLLLLQFVKSTSVIWSTPNWDHFSSHFNSTHFSCPNSSRTKKVIPNSSHSIYEKIDNKLLDLIKQYENGQLSPTELAIKSGKTVKIKKGKK